MAIKTDEERLTSSQLAKVEAAQKKWQAANKAGDTAGMEAAHKEAEAVRNSAGYKSDGTGNYAGSYSGGSSGGGSKGGNSQYTNTNKVYNPDTDYQSLIDQAVAVNDFKTAALYEQLRNQKILGEGLDYELTYKYSNVPNGNTTTKEDILDWKYEEAKPEAPERDPRIDKLLNQILTREDFSYDAMNDPLYQQYVQAYQREGDRAMRETLAEAASSAGGMNSYAITAAQQANNYYNSQLQDKIPELYQLAYQMYLQDKESQVQDLGLLQSMDATQYNRYRDTMNDYYKDKNFAYGQYSDAVNQGNWQTNFDYNSMWDNINYNTDSYWKNKEWNANQEEVAYNRGIDDQESAKKELWQLLELGVAPSDDLIARAGMSRADVNLALAAIKAQLNKTTSKSSGGSSGGSGGGGSKSSGSGNGNGYTGNSDLSDYEIKTGQAGSSWTGQLGETESGDVVVVDNIAIPKGELANIMTEQEWSSRRGSHEVGGKGATEVTEYKTYQEYYDAYIDYLKLKYSEN